MAACLKATLQYFMMAVTLIVVAVPEGLPMSVTLSLALNMRRMLSTNNLGAEDACLRNNGGNYRYLYGQDGYADTKPDAGV